MADYTPGDVRIAALAEATGVSEADLRQRAQEIRDGKLAEIRADLGIPEPGSVEEAIGVVLANNIAAGEDEPYLDSFEAQELAAALMREVVDELVDEHAADVARLTRELDDERGSHAMTKEHFVIQTDYIHEWDEQTEAVARLTQLLDAAQLARDGAQADASMYAGVIEAVRVMAVELRGYSETAPPGEFKAWPEWFGSRVLAVLAGVGPTYSVFDRETGELYSRPAVKSDCRCGGDDLPHPAGTPGCLR